MPGFKVFHYETRSARDPIEEFLEAQPTFERVACDEVIEWLETGELGAHPRNSDYLGDGLWELRLSSNRKQYRFIYATVSAEAYLLVAFIKKTPQTPPRHLEQARKRLRELRTRGIIP